jgi:transposase
MLKIEFSEAEVKALHYERYHHPHPRVQRKMEIVYLKSHALSHQEICRLSRITGNTLRSYLNEYQRGGIEQLKQLNFHRPESELMAHRASLEEHLQKHPPASINQARDVIKELTGIERSPRQVGEFLKHIGLKRRKVGMIPAKADTEEQARFKQEELEPRLEEAKNGKRAVFFMDASHFGLSPFLGFLWSGVRIFIPAPSGRQRFNVLGALNAITQEVFTVTNQTYITSVQVCELLTQLVALGLGGPITVVLDNARYQRCQRVLEHAASLGIELLFLPPYSPNLNLIERLWKFVKKQCLYSKYYEKFEPFKQAISDCLALTSTKYKSELKSLLTLNFQAFEKTQIVTV